MRRGIKRLFGFIETFSEHFAIAHNHTAYLTRSIGVHPPLRLLDCHAHETLIFRRVVHILALLLAIPVLLSAGVGAETSQAVRTVELNPDDCFRVRELQLTRGGVQFSLTDGYLIFSKPVLGAPVAAFFSAAVEGGDAEVLLLPPDRDERRVLSAHTGKPNLEEHLREAAFFFADDTAVELHKQIEASETMHKDPDYGSSFAATYTPVLRSIVRQFETRLLLDLLANHHDAGGFFASMLGGRTVGNFDVVFDPRSTEQIMAGQDTGTDFKIWTSYTPKSLRQTPRAEDFHADEYHIDSVMDSDLRMHVTTAFTVSHLTHDLRALSFDLSRQMHILSAEIDGRPAEIVEGTLRTDPVLDSDDRIFLIIPTEPLKTDTEHKLTVIHEGNVITAGENHVYFVGSRGRWYPHRALEFARFDLKFRFPKELDLVAPGTAVLDTVDGEDRIIERRIDTPIPIAGFNLGAYARTVIKRGEFTVEMCANRPEVRRFPLVPPAEPERDLRKRNHTLLETFPTVTDPIDRTTALANKIADVLEFYAHHFGPPPLKRLIVTPIPGRFGQGFGGLLYLSVMAYMSPSGRAFTDLPGDQKLFFTELMYAHEVAHQWWGNLVLTSGYHDEWIAEALANYSAMLYLEKRVGPDAVASLLSTYRDGLIRKSAAGIPIEEAGPVTQGRRLDLEGEPAAWVAIMYGKGTWIIRMLQARMGEDAFWKMLAELRHRYERKSISTEQFRQLCAEFMPKDAPDRTLTEFFDQWVYGMGIPSLKLSTATKGVAGALRLTGTLTQQDVPEDFSADFPVVIDVHGKKKTVWVRSSSDPVMLNVPVAARPDHVRLDPDNQFLKR